SGLTESVSALIWTALSSSQRYLISHVQSTAKNMANCVEPMRLELSALRVTPIRRMIYFLHWFLGCISFTLLSWLRSLARGEAGRVPCERRSPHFCGESFLYLL
ncbi:unnamed protein product, partial [Gulo gulo]